MALLQIRVDEELKNQANAIYNELGIDLSTAVRMFLKKSVLEGGIPFDTKVDSLTLSTILSVDKMRTTSESNGNSEMSLDEINEEIKAARKERKNRRWNIMLWLTYNGGISNHRKYQTLSDKKLYCNAKTNDWYYQFKTN